MNIAVRYHTRGGNTQKVADAIATAVGVTAQTCAEAISSPVDVLFLGGSVYGFGQDDEIKKFITDLNSSSIKAVALFGTSAIVKSGNQEMKKLLNQKGIKVLDKDFHCYGAFTLMHRGHPNADDLQRAGNFAKAVLPKTS
jgi:flavodoxin